MWTKVSSPQDRDALVQDHLARRDRLRQRFEAEKLGEAYLQTEASKLFKPITSEVQKQSAAQTQELAKITSAVDNIAQIDPVEPRALLSKAEAAALIVDPDKDLKTDLIRQHGFTPPSELDLSDETSITELIAQITHYNRYKLGANKKKADTHEERDSLTAEIQALAAYRERLRLLTAGRKLTEQRAAVGTGLQLKLRGDQFGDLTIDPVSLASGKVRAFRGGSLVLEAPADDSLHRLLTKRFIKAKQYTPEAIETFKQLVALAGLPVHGRKSKKHQLIRGGAVQFYDDPNVLVERLQLLLASKQAGNTGLDNEISAILDELMRSGAISKDLALQLNRSLFVV